MSDPIQNAVTDALEELDTPPAEGGVAASGEETKPKTDTEGAGGGEGGTTPPAGTGDGGGEDEDAGGEGEGAGGGDELPAEVTTALGKEPKDLTDDEKTLIADNRDKLTDEQVEPLVKAGVLEDENKPVTGEPVVEEKPKLHKVPESDDDLVLEIEDAEGNKIKISSLADLPSDFMYKDSKQPIEVMQGLQKLDNTRAERAKLREENNSTNSNLEYRKQVGELWDSEIAQMQKDGAIPAGDANWREGKYGSKKVKDAIDGIFAFMVEANKQRAENNLPLISSFKDAADAKDLADRRAAEVEAAKHKKDVKTKQAEVVAGSKTSTASSSDSGKPSYVKGSGVSIQDIVEESLEGLSS